MARAELRFEHSVINPLKSILPPGSRCLLAVSGGLDSMVMAEVLRRWRRLLKIDLGVAYIHHGKGRGRNYRQRARAHVEAWCLEAKLPFFTNSDTTRQLRSEAEMRAFRQTHLEGILAAEAYDLISFAHHRDDLLETRMLRLLRGTGPQGLRAMSLYHGKRLRPLLSVSRREIEEYAGKRELAWIEDPSNCQTDALRNWLRHRWLPLLEKRQKGASTALARSLEMLTVAPTDPVLDVGLRRESMKMASSRQREQMIAAYLHQLGVRDYARTHVHEILKRLDTRVRNFQFEILGIVFEVTPDLLSASRGLRSE